LKTAPISLIKAKLSGKIFLGNRSKRCIKLNGKKLPNNILYYFLSISKIYNFWDIAFKNA